MGVAIEELGPGKQSSPAHYHLFEEEHVYILEGELTARIGSAAHRMRAGDYVCFPAGQKAGHCLVNEGAAPCRYVIVGERNPNEVVVYTDSNKVLVRGAGAARDLRSGGAARLLGRRGHRSRRRGSPAARCRGRGARGAGRAEAADLHRRCAMGGDQRGRAVRRPGQAPHPRRRRRALSCRHADRGARARQAPGAPALSHAGRGARADPRRPGDAAARRGAPRAARGRLCLLSGRPEARPFLPEQRHRPVQLPDDRRAQPERGLRLS